VNVTFVDGKQEVLGMALGGDREATREVGENNGASEFRRRLDAATQDGVGEFIRVVVVKIFGGGVRLGVMGIRGAERSCEPRSRIQCQLRLVEGRWSARWLWTQ
jgi:hypothetical protein